MYYNEAAYFLVLSLHSRTQVNILISNGTLMTSTFNLHKHKTLLTTNGDDDAKNLFSFRKAIKLNNQPESN